jgi:hypothetical protein
MSGLVNPPIGFPGTTGSGLRDPFGAQAEKARRQAVAAARKAAAVAAAAKVQAARKAIKPFDKKFIKKELGTVLRYPYEALTDETDYLQIDIREYNPVKSLSRPVFGPPAPGQLSVQSRLTSNGSRRQNDKFNDVSELTTQELNSLRQILNAKGSILLPIPSNVQDANSVSYTEGKIDRITSDIYSELSKNTVTANPNSQNQNQATNAFNQIGQQLGSKVQNIGKRLFSDPRFGSLLATSFQAQAANIPLGGSLTRDQVLARSSGQVLNQNVELLFNGVTLRSFKFSFKLTPRNPNEAEQVYYIIESLKLNMAAKVNSEDPFFLSTPNVFELTYKQGKDRHPFLNNFKQCVLTDMSINYTGEGTYAVYDDSTPVSIILDLGFKELEPIYDLDYDDNLPGVGY